MHVHVQVFMSFPAYKTVSGVNGPLVILDDVKVKITCTVSMLQMTDVTVLFLSKIHLHFPNIYIYMTCMSN